MPRSMGNPPASRNARYSARRGSGRCPSMPRAMSGAAGPEIRTIPTPPRPGGVATAAIVSVSASPRGLRLLLDPARDVPLLQDREHAVHQPVQDEPRREEGEEQREDE